MKAIFWVFWNVLRQRLFLVVVAVVVLISMTGCYTTNYDSYGRPVQSVDPAVALLGVAAAGVIGYAIANNNDHDDYRHRSHGYSGRNYYQPSYGYSNYNRGYGYGGRNYCRY